MCDRAWSHRADSPIATAAPSTSAGLLVLWLFVSAAVVGNATAEETGPTPAVPVTAGALDEFDSLRLLHSKEAGKDRLILGDIHGFVHIYEQRGESWQEMWVSEYFEGSISGIFITDINNDELDEIVVYTDAGRFFFLDIEDYNTIWSNPPNEYEIITAMFIYNVDDDVQDELIFVADGRLIIYDGRDQFEEWRSEQDNIEATYIVVGDVDGDGADEIVLNDGYVFDARYRDLEWQSSQSFGARMGLLDVDGDGILEVIGEFGDRFLRIFDVDLRRMKAPRR